ncbi:unnamed protein product [Cuscuta europaea]|uniref:Uncharacterized protein n=1 Tax=Cuscuta europaea TaxID=41803 RepID=A0A9P0Z501_CUSEU|nr:unnamed protein product [Cuscuta europaea]
MDDVGALGSIPQEHVSQDFFRREKLEAILPRGPSILEGSLSPSALMRKVMPSTDRLALTRMDESTIEAKILLSSAFNFMGLCEYLRRVEQMREARGAADAEAVNLRKMLAEAEDSLCMATESMEQWVQAAKAQGIAEAKVTGAKVARVAAEEAERAKAEEVAKAERVVVEAFVTGGWMGEDRESWVSSVVEKKVDSWVEGPGKMWLAVKGDS